MGLMDMLARFRGPKTPKRVERADYDAYNGVPDSLVWNGGNNNIFANGLSSVDTAWGALQQYRYNWQLAAVVDRIAMDVASVDWYVEELRGGEWQEVDEDHRLAQFIDEPWQSFAFGSLRDLIDFWQRSVDVCSDAFGLIVLENKWEGKIVEILPLPAHAVTPFPIYNPVFERWEFWFSCTLAGLEIPSLVPPHCMFWHRRVSLDRPLERGLGRLQALESELKNYEFSMRFNNLFFKNGAAPDMIVGVMGDDSAGNMKKLKLDWENQYTGLQHAARTLFVKSDLKVIQTRSSQRDMQWQEGMDRTGLAMCRYYGVPPSIVGWGAATKSDAETDDHAYEKRTVLPRVKALGTSMNRQIFGPYFSRGAFRSCRIAFRNVVKKSDAQQLEESVQAAVTGNISRDEYRIRQGIKPCGGELGKQFLVPRNAIAVTEEQPYGPPREETGQADDPNGGQAPDGVDQGPNVAGGAPPKLAKTGNLAPKMSKPGKVVTKTPKTGAGQRAAFDDDGMVTRCVV